MTGFAQDRVDNWTPVTFALEFTRRLRGDKRASQRPSIRTTLSIPRFLTARYFRTHLLTPRDYLDAAVLNTLPEDQDLAENLARELLFPRPSDQGDELPGEKPTSVPPPEPNRNAEEDVLADLAALDVDFEALDDLSQLDGVLNESDEKVLASYDLFERLYSSADASERSLAQLVVDLGGPGELQATGAATLTAVEHFVQARLSAEVGALRPAHIEHGCQAGFASLLLEECCHAWELAGGLAGCNHPDLAGHLDALLQDGTARELGRTLVFLRPFEKTLDPEVMRRFQNGLLSRANDLSDLVELIIGLDSWLEPSEEILRQSIQTGVVRALQAARWIRENYEVDLAPRLFDVWLESIGEAPDLGSLCEVRVDCDRYREQLVPAFTAYLADTKEQAGSTYESLPQDASAAAALPDVVADTVAMAGQLEQTGIDVAMQMAGRLCCEGLCMLRHTAHFLPLLDAFLDRGVLPDDLGRVIDKARQLGIDPDEVYDRIGDAQRQLDLTIRADGRDAERYMRLAERVCGIPEEMIAELCVIASRNRNLEAIASLLAIDLGGACANLSEDEVMAGLGYKGIGAGPNQLRQWFHHRSSINAAVREQIKAVTKEALVDLAFDWIGKGGGSGEQGLLPQTASRPYRAGDDLDLLDIDASLESLVTAGKRLEDVTAQDLCVSDTSRGCAALVVLIDISGSMSGDELAVCAIAVVMLLGRVRSKEIALAVFESDTHVIKEFSDVADLDEVADQVLELEATGGTQVDAALSWSREQFETAAEADFRLLFLLSDFCFAEEPEELARHGSALADLGAVFLGASHGWVEKEYLDVLLRTTRGRRVDLRSVKRLPEILLETLGQIGDGAFR